MMEVWSTLQNTIEIKPTGKEFQSFILRWNNQNKSTTLKGTKLQA